ncbi:class I SAM-dependent methyltransferase [Methyloceanibacter methanicus]|nr:class I SAM-dependent methyltransferase [Methyloceanibacter methanicus]
MTDYILPHSDPLEDDRLMLMSKMLDPYTRFRISQLGLGAGWKCLEVGAGNGTISQWLADRVGPTGHVTAADIDTRFLDRLARPNLDIRQLDVVKDPLGDAYDLVCARAILHHIPERLDVMARLAAAVKPGGFILLEEPDFHPVLDTDSPAVRDFWRGFLAWAANCGIDYFVGRRVAPTLSKIGMADIDVHGETIMFQGGSASARYWTLTFAELREPILALGLITPTLWNEALALFDNPEFWSWQNCFVVTTARKPA